MAFFDARAVCLSYIGSFSLLVYDWTGNKWKQKQIIVSNNPLVGEKKKKKEKNKSH